MARAGGKRGREARSTTAADLRAHEDADGRIRHFLAHYWSTGHLAHDVDARRGSDVHGAGWFVEQRIPESIREAADLALGLANSLDSLILELCSLADPARSAPGLPHNRRVTEAAFSLKFVTGSLEETIKGIRKPTSRGSARSPAEVVKLGHAVRSEAQALEQLADALADIAAEPRLTGRGLPDSAMAAILHLAFQRKGPLKGVWPSPGRWPGALRRLLKAAREANPLGGPLFPTSRAQISGSADGDRLVVRVLLKRAELMKAAADVDAQKKGDELCAAIEAANRVARQCLLVRHPPRGAQRVALLRGDSDLEFALSRRSGNRWWKLAAALLAPSSSAQ